jgi:thiol:disulfide interchange protein DsbD
VSFLIYTTLGLGMAAPYMALATFPVLLKFVPKPGRWMETLKHALGFVLAATVIWLGWVLASQAGSTALVVMMLMLLLLSIAAWVYGRWGSVAADVSRRWLGRAVAAFILLIAFAAGSAGVHAFGIVLSRSPDMSGDGIAWQEFSQTKLDRLRSDGKAVFIDFTAAWCLSCQLNEKVAFSSQEVQNQFKKLDIQPLKADWTNRSAEIAQALARYGRNSVPLYVLYAPGSDDPILLPEILTPGIVLDALDTIETHKKE